MPWREVSVMDRRREFVMLAKQEGVNRRQLCRQFGISAQTGYKWIERYEAGDTALADWSRRPHHSPDRTAAAIERQIVALRDAHPVWGARKIAHRLKRDRQVVPAISTVHSDVPPIFASRAADLPPAANTRSSLSSPSGLPGNSNATCS